MGKVSRGTTERALEACDEEECGHTAEPWGFIGKQLCEPASKVVVVTAYFALAICSELKFPSFFEPWVVSAAKKDITQRGFYDFILWIYYSSVCF